ncbi:uncharacterized protein LOC118512322 [Anopheles stephensi]|uniref:Uncharacterized protein n=1 Tax=Anopheles stephensi TaxID=30069 RepID=A0A182YHZ0_ANOST|nr:uncharacterized protein LOC118512322 [Anopheles stephensi]
MSSPSDHKPATADRCYNDKSPPLYPSTHRFQPLGFSTPQQRGDFSFQARNCYSAQPKHLLPRAKGSDGRYRHRPDDTPYQDRSNHFSQDRTGNAEQRNANFNSGKRLGFGHSWRGHNNRNQRFGGHRPQHNHRQRQTSNESYNIGDYFHPSMLEDPWEFWLRKDNPAIDHSPKQESSDRAEEEVGDIENSDE